MERGREEVSTASLNQDTMIVLEFLGVIILAVILGIFASVAIAYQVIMAFITGIQELFKKQ